MQDPRIALETHAREELGLDPDELGSPWGAAISSFIAFSIGAVIPLLPFVLASGSAAVIAAISASAISLFAVGASLSALTGKSTWRSGSRMLVRGAVAAAITFLVGRLFHVAASG